MPVYYTQPENIHEDYLELEGDEAHHIVRVMRLDKGAALEVVDGLGNSFNTEIVAKSSKKVECRILTRTRNKGEPFHYLTLAAGLSTGSKFDEVIEKGTELGVSRFIPVTSAKGKIKDLDEKGRKRRLERWQKIALAAIKQSGRSVLPQILPVLRLEELFYKVDNTGPIFLFDPSGEKSPQGSAFTAGQQRYTVLVGSESGFTREELEMARGRGAAVWHLGKRILRAENAAPTAAALVMYLLGEFN